MRTSDIARIVGCTPRTIRHYHQIGIVPEPLRDANGYRNYGFSDLARILRAKALSDAGVPLSDIDDEVDIDRALSLLDDKIRLLKSQRQRLLALSNHQLAVPDDIQILLRQIFRDEEFAAREIASFQIMALLKIADEDTWKALRQRLTNLHIVETSRAIEDIWLQLGKLEPNSNRATQLVSQLEELFPDCWLAGLPLSPGNEIHLNAADIEIRGAQILAYAEMAKKIAEDQGL
ncbi:MerR family transcriptional regulator [Corynebacterium lactis]|uniref:Regulatory protein n=1 Tax=Corynebacterium lactis RW2-5 TaxID=1408189 RepID=A0A0K2H0B8_9CORY|nr:MerR family transcriptional regulator [Corynebacterium lactis]ALA67166.1 regulatory protein [Corynebacterium lactis RW2-5]